MKSQPYVGLTRFAAGILVALTWAGAGFAATLLDDNWSDGSRDEQNLPAESQWFCSGGTANLTNTAPGSMTFIADPSGSMSAITYFATNGLPISLADGEAITLTVDFFVNGVVENAAQSMRFALVDYSAGTRVDADEGSSGLNGENVTGYGFFTHISSLVQRETLDIKERTGITSTDLLGSSGAWATTLAEAWDEDFFGIQDSTPYTMSFSVTRSGTNAVVTNTLTGGGLNLVAAGTNSPGWFNFDAFGFRNSGADETAASFTFTRIQVEGPAGLPAPPAIVAQPQDLTRTLGQQAEYTVAASGAQPLYFQWYYNATNGIDTLLLAGETNSTVILPGVTYADAGGYFAVVSNAVGVATSEVATLTVNPPDPTPPGVVLDDTFDDQDRLTGPVSETNSVWYASTATSLEEWPGYIRGVPDPSSSRLWIGYFTEDPLAPVELAVGTAIKVTLGFTPGSAVSTATGRGLRIGLFDYATGGTRVTGDGFGSGSTGNGENVPGYMVNCNFSSPFGVDTFAEIRARSSPSSGNLLGTTSVWTSLGSGPTGYLGLAGIQGGVPYTLEMMITRTSASEVRVSYRLQGGSLDLQFEVTDATYPVNRFDAIAVRANRSTDTADAIDITNLKVEVVEVVVPPTPFPITGAMRVGADALSITWGAEPGRTYEVQSRDSLMTGDWVSGPPVVAEGASQSYTNTGISGVDTQFYRVIVP